MREPPQVYHLEPYMNNLESDLRGDNPFALSIFVIARTYKTY